MIDIEKLYNEAETLFEKEDYENAFNLFLKCAEKLDKESLYMVGFMYENALGV